MADDIRRAEYGLHSKKIEIDQPNIDITSSEGKTNKFYLGERYIEDFSEVDFVEDENGKKYKYDNAKKQTVAVSKTDGTIFDKSTNASSTNKINENEFVEKITKKEGEKTTEEVVKTYLDFDPSNTTSRLYRGTYENTYNIEEATKVDANEETGKIYYPGSEYQKNIKVKNNNYNESKITVNNNNSVLNKNINTDRLNNYVNLKDFYEADNVGATPWDGKNDFNAIATNVDMQDELLLDDIENSGDLTKLGKATTNSIRNLQNNVGAVKGAKSLVNGLKSKKEPEFT